MFERKKSIFKFHVILPWILMVCIVFSLQIQCEKGGQEESSSQVTFLPPLSSEEVLQLEIKFQKDLEEKFFSVIKKHFNKNVSEDIDYDAIADIMVKYGEKINFYDLSGYKMTSKDDYIKFWKDAKLKRKAVKVDFTILSSRVIPLAEPIKLGPPDYELNDSIIATGYAVFIYRLIKETEGKITNSIGSGTYSARHPKWCEW